MSIKPDHWIIQMARDYGMIEPFQATQVRSGAISYGVSSYGYDIRVAEEFKIFTNVHSAVVDPKDFDPRSMVDFKGDVCVIPPNSFALARTVEYFRIPRNVLTICVGKSTYARCGIIVNVTPFEPEWEGYVTLEISNTTPFRLKFMPMRVLRRFCSSRLPMSVKYPMLISKGSISVSNPSSCPSYNLIVIGLWLVEIAISMTRRLEYPALVREARSHLLPVPLRLRALAVCNLILLGTDYQATR